MSDSNVIRVGILSDSIHGSKYVHDLVGWMISRSEFVVTHLILHPAPQEIAPRNWPPRFIRSVRNFGLYALISGKLFNVLMAIERVRLSRDKNYSDHQKKYNLQELIRETLLLDPIVSSSGLSYRFAAADINRIRSLGLDVLIRCGGGILRGDILSSSRLGVVSFHHADNRINRGVPAGFWEVYNRQSTTGFTLQRLSEELDGGEVLLRGHFPTRHYYLLNQAALYEKSNHYLKLILGRIASLGRLPPPIPSIPYSQRLFRQPTARQSLAYLGRSLGSMAAKKIRKIAGRDEKWQVSFLRSGWRNAVLRRGINIPNPPGGYLADPFVISRNGRDYCFVEDYDYSARRGRISVYEIGAGGAERLGIVLDEPFHLSFPYLFEYQGDLLMCPESSANRDVRLYRCVDFPLVWKLEATIMSDSSAVDSMLFERAGKWWLLTNVDPTNSGEYCSALFAYSANSPLSTSWRPHAQNPVVLDASCARNAGLLFEDGKVFRVSQRQGFDRYGEGCQINEIVELTDDTYEETCIAKIEPSFGDRVLATHHFHSRDDVTVFDYLVRSSL